MGYSTNHTLPFYSHYPNTPLGSSNGAIALRECVVFMGILNTILCTHSFSLSIFYSFFLSLSLTHPLTIGKHFCSYSNNAKSSIFIL